MIYLVCNGIISLWTSNGIVGGGANMYSNKKGAVIGSVAAVIVLVAIAVSVWLAVPRIAMEADGTVNQVTFSNPTTNIAVTEPKSTTEEQTTVTTTVPETTTMSEMESYLEAFLAEAGTYSQTVESTTNAPGSKTFFHVVTSGGTVSDDRSLEGLTGIAKTVGQVILGAGFRYDKEQGIFYSESESWQRNFGFTPLYDVGAALTGMYYDTMRINFTYGGHDWRFQLWKGRYGITTGAEMGVYYKQEGTDTEFYECVPDSEMIVMSYALYRGDEVYMLRGPERHWWLTGFKLFDMVAPQELTMHATFFMDNNEMADALEASLKELGYIEGVNYQRLGLTMTIIWN